MCVHNVRNVCVRVVGVMATNQMDIVSTHPPQSVKHAATRAKTKWICVTLSPNCKNEMGTKYPR